MRFAAVFSLMLLAIPARAQLVVKLAPQTLSAFESYAKMVESQLNQRWQGRKPFLFLDQEQQAKQRVISGDVFVKQMHDGGPVSITQGLIHDWLAAVFVPQRSAKQVVQLLEDFNRHQKIYPAVAKSRLISRNGDEITGYWQLRQKAGMLPVVLDVKENVHYQQIAPGKWKGVAYARDITEINAGLFGNGKKFPPGEGHGYLWRLYSYWTLEDVSGGVIAECRTLSLSRDVPAGLAWAVGPYVQKTPEESLRSILKATREALGK